MCGLDFFFFFTRTSVIEGEWDEQAKMGAFEPPSIVLALWESYLCLQHTHTGRLNYGANADWTRADLPAHDLDVSVGEEGRMKTKFTHTKSYYLKFSISIIFLWVFMFLFHSNSHFQWWGALSPYKMIMNILSRQVIIWLIILHYRLLQQKLQEHIFSEFSIKSIRPQTPKLH